MVSKLFQAAMITLLLSLMAETSSVARFQTAAGIGKGGQIGYALSLLPPIPGLTGS